MTRFAKSRGFAHYMLEWRILLLIAPSVLGTFRHGGLSIEERDSDVPQDL